MTYKFVLLTLETDRDGRFTTLVNDTKWPVLHIFLDICFIYLMFIETFCAEDGAGLVGVESILGRVMDHGP